MFDADPVATPMPALGHFFHHAVIGPTPFFASLHPCGVNGFFVCVSIGKTAHPYCVAYLIAACKYLFVILF
jgi:hypothetical protein